MNRADRWFDARQDDAPPLDPGGVPASLDLSAVGRLLVASPAGPPARTLAALGSGRRPLESARRVPGGLADAGARRLHQVAPADDGAGAGSVSLSAPAAGDAPLPPGNWRRRNRAPVGTEPASPGDRSGRRSRRSHAGSPPCCVRRQSLLLAATGPMEWPRPLLPYQLVAVRELIDRDSLLLADDMGLGKTVSRPRRAADSVSPATDRGGRWSSSRPGC